ncbi:unnamed protein product, partial [marine sediment metagenome]
AVRVGVGGFAKIVLKLLGINVFSYVSQIGKAVFSKDIGINNDMLEEIDKSEVRCPDRTISLQMKEEIIKAERNGDSVGGKFKIIATGVPPGLGSYTTVPIKRCTTANNRIRWQFSFYHISYNNFFS